MNILFAGHDFKFASDIIEHFTNIGWEVSLDQWDNHNKHDEERSLSYLEKADIIFCEWGLGNIVYYSHHKKPNQILAVRLHLQERDLPYMKNINITNIDYFFIVAPYIYEELVHKFRLPRNKTKIIYNLVNKEKYTFESNHQERKYNIGICGITPKRKRLDLALDIIEHLYNIDKRYKLYIKGKNPLEYEWIKGCNEEKEYFLEQANRIRKMKCKKNIIFEDFSPDMNKWYQKIGYVLSPSDFESFHMVVAEGMLAGCIPIIINREGANMLFPSKYIFKTVEDMINGIKEKREPGDYTEVRNFVLNNYESCKICSEIDNYLLKDDQRFLTKATTTGIKKIVDVFIRRALRNPSKPVVIMNTTIKSPYDNRNHKIQYRGVSLAHELDEDGIPVIILYYNWNDETQYYKVQKGPLFLPASFFLYNIDSLGLDRILNKKYFICCIPDERSMNMLERFKQWNWKTIYDIWDDWEEMAKTGMGKSWYSKDLERKISLLTDKITTVSPMLANKALRDFEAKKVTTIPNAVSSSFISLTKDILDKAANEKKCKTIGYFGHLGGKWFDWNSVINLANLYSDFTIELIGPAYPADKEYPTNITFRGPLNQEEIIEYAKDWQLALIPFGETILDKSVDPIKIYEYLALGLKTVSADMGNVKNYPLTWIYGNGNSLASVVKKALDYKITEDDIKKIKDFLKKNTWRDRMLYLLDEK